MTALLIVLILLALVGFGLERNHRRNGYAGRSGFGSTDIEDRDEARARIDAAAAYSRWPSANPRYRVVRRARERSQGRRPARGVAPLGRFSAR